MRTKFDEQLDNLNKELITMGTLCESAIAKAVKSLIEEDLVLAAEVVQSSTQIDQKERDIERICLKMLLQQQPVAHDLRQISAALKMITDMERIGDQAEDIAEIVTMGKILSSEKLSHISDMALETIKMVTQSIDAYITKDIELALKVIKQDDIVDTLFAEVKIDIADLLRKGGNGESALDLLMIAKYFERIGDHATNIAEWVVFSITGEHKSI